MKLYIKNYFIIILTLLFLTFLTSLILTILYRNEIISYKASLIIANSFSYILIAILSFILGIKVKKFGFVHALIFSILILCLTLIFKNNIYNGITIIKLATKSLIIIFFTILGVNKRTL